MEQYLSALMPEIGFCAEDTAYFLAVYRKIAADPAAGAAFAADIAAFAADRFDFGEEAAHSAAVGAAVGEHAYTVSLLFYLCLARETERRYRAAGIPREIFVNTMRDLAYKLEECKLVRGVRGTFVGFWMPKAFTLGRFGIGRLQYQFTTFKAETYRKNGRFLQTGDPVLGLHIPRTGTPMDAESCTASFAAAKTFFADRFKGDIPITCHSWLLYPPMRTALKEGSNTARFYDLFDILKSEDNPAGKHPDMWRLFDTDDLDPATLPRNGSLRRAYAARIEAGLPTGSGYGLLWI